MSDPGIDRIRPQAAAEGLDLGSLRDQFPILGRTTYLISNSLGAMPRAVEEELGIYVDSWRQRGVQAWHEGWWEMPVTVGDLVAPILGVGPGQISMHQNVTLATAVFLSCLDYPPRRNRIVFTELNFPSLQYLAEGERKRGAEIVSVPSEDAVGVPTERLLEAVDERTRIVAISHVLFKSAYIQDAVAVARRCREVGALLLLDVFQSAGILPLELEAWGVDAAVGGALKWLCGGPGAAFLWVRPGLQDHLAPTLTGWQADEEPFAFRPGVIRRAKGAWRFLTGTPNIPALHACRPGLRIIGQVGPERIRRRSLALTSRLIEHADCAGLEVRTPREPERRGGTVTVWHAKAEELCRELLQRQILCDFRPSAGIRLSPHFYNTEEECDRAVEVLAELAASARFA